MKNIIFLLGVLLSFYANAQNNLPPNTINLINGEIDLSKYKNDRKNFIDLSSLEIKSEIGENKIGVLNFSNEKKYNLFIRVSQLNEKNVIFPIEDYINYIPYFDNSLRAIVQHDTINSQYFLVDNENNKKKLLTFENWEFETEKQDIKQIITLLNQSNTALIERYIPLLEKPDLMVNGLELFNYSMAYNGYFFDIISFKTPDKSNKFLWWFRLFDKEDYIWQIFSNKDEMVRFNDFKMLDFGDDVSKIKVIGQELDQGVLFPNESYSIYFGSKTPDKKSLFTSLYYLENYWSVQALLNSKPESVVQEHLGDEFLKEGEFVKALSSYSNAIKIDSLNHGVLIKMFMVSHYQGEYEKADIYLASYFENESKFNEGYLPLMVKNMIEVKKYKEALNFSSAILDNDKLYEKFDKDVISDIYMYRIISYLQLERRNEACSDVKKLLIIDPSLKDELLGICFNNEDDTEKTSQYDFKIPGKVGRLKTNGRKIKKGEEIQIVASGSVVFGMFAGSASPNGFTNGAFKSYNILGGANHGALLFRIGQGDWYFVGTEMTIISKDEGDMQFLINDADASNNSGEFKVQVRIK